MVSFTILAGGYSAAIATYVFDTDTYAFDLVGQSEMGGNSSWISLHPTNDKILYSTNEYADATGAIQSFLIDDNGLLSQPLSTVSSKGEAPLFITGLSTGEVGVVNYWTGNGRILPTTDGLYFDDSAPSINFPASESHPHQVVEYCGEVFVPDLGADKIWRLLPSSPGVWDIHGYIEQPSGSGPRHIAIKDGYLFTLHETANTLISQLLPDVSETSSPIISSKIVTPPNANDGAKFAAAEILIPAVSNEFSGSYVYTSNRNSGTQDAGGDAITIFKRGKEGELELATYVYTGLSQVRSMAFFGEDDRYLVAGGGAGDAGVLVFERTGDGGDLTLVAGNTDIPTRITFVAFPSCGHLY